MYEFFVYVAAEIGVACLCVFIPWGGRIEGSNTATALLVQLFRLARHGLGSDH